MPISGTIKLEIRLAENTTANTTGTVKHDITETYTWTLGEGTGANQLDDFWSADFSLAATSTTYDLTALTGPRGTVAFTKVKGILIYVSTATDGHTLLVGNAATNAWFAPFSGATVTHEVMAGGAWFTNSHLAQTTNPWTVNSTNKNLKLDAGANTIAGTIIIWGV